MSVRSALSSSPSQASNDFLRTGRRALGKSWWVVSWFYGEVDMDEQDFLSKVNLLTQSPTLEGRLKQLLETTRTFFNLDICSLLFVPDSGEDFHIVSCRDGTDLIQEERGQYFCADRSDHASSEVMVFRRNGGVDGESDGIFTRNFRVESVAGADFRPLQNLEVRLRLTRNQVQGEFSDREIELIERLIASIRGAVLAATQEKYATLFNGYAQKLLACLRVGMFIVSPRLEILEKSPLAEELLLRLRSYRCSERWLAGASEEHQAKLDQALFELNANSELRYRVVDIITMGRGEQYPVVIARAPALPPAFTESNFVVFIFSSGEDLFNVDRLLSLWQISPAEKRVLTAIARYDNIKKVALELNISPNTAKAQLKSVYKKLGVGSKMRLMKRLNVLRNVEALMS
jgi:DNA-binding CsgD family transcriptional regulator